MDLEPPAIRIIQCSVAPTTHPPDPQAPSTDTPLSFPSDEAFGEYLARRKGKELLAGALWTHTLICHELTPTEVVEVEQARKGMASFSWKTSLKMNGAFKQGYYLYELNVWSTNKKGKRPPLIPLSRSEFQWWATTFDVLHAHRRICDRPEVEVLLAAL